jgi:hypothetical protein
MISQERIDRLLSATVALAANAAELNALLAQIQKAQAAADRSTSRGITPAVSAFGKRRVGREVRQGTKTERRV